MEIPLKQKEVNIYTPKDPKKIFQKQLTYQEQARSVYDEK